MENNHGVEDQGEGVSGASSEGGGGGGDGSFEDQREFLVSRRVGFSSSLVPRLCLHSSSPKYLTNSHPFPSLFSRLFPSLNSPPLKLNKPRPVLSASSPCPKLSQPLTTKSMLSAPWSRTLPASFTLRLRTRSYRLSFSINNGREEDASTRLVLVLVLDEDYRTGRSTSSVGVRRGSC